MKIIKIIFVLLVLILITITAAANAVENTNETNKTDITGAQNKTGDENEKPGFEALFAISGLTAVVYLLKRK